MTHVSHHWTRSCCRDGNLALSFLEQKLLFCFIFLWILPEWINKYKKVPKYMSVCVRIYFINKALACPWDFLCNDSVCKWSGWMKLYCDRLFCHHCVTLHREYPLQIVRFVFVLVVYPLVNAVAKEIFHCRFNLFHHRLALVKNNY